MPIRPLDPQDIDAAIAVAQAALQPYVGDPGPGTTAWLQRRFAHMHRTDPGGCWVAEDDDGEVAGIALAIVREEVWGLSLLAVDPRTHARGIGTRLITAALTHEDGGRRGGLIVSSPDPKAMRLYARSGFDLHPTIDLAGVLDRTAIPAGLRARTTEDLEQAGALGRAVRGAAYAAEDLAMLSLPVHLIEGRGFAVERDGAPVLLCATDEDAAADLLWSCLAAAAPGASVHVDFVAAGHDWAVQACLAAGLAITPGGPIYARGDLGPLRPWIPSGSLL
jgi:ribosomal protein S18 acetylase RimI-like enzyme